MEAGEALAPARLAQTPGQVVSPWVAVVRVAAAKRMEDATWVAKAAEAMVTAGRENRGEATWAVAAWVMAAWAVAMWAVAVWVVQVAQREGRGTQVREAGGSGRESWGGVAPMVARREVKWAAAGAGQATLEAGEMVEEPREGGGVVVRSAAPQAVEGMGEG